LKVVTLSGWLEANGRRLSVRVVGARSLFFENSIASASIVSAS
jgi:hypothetical protein